jgi:hypothetical protein
MRDQRKKRLTASLGIQQMLVDELLAQSEEEVLDSANRDGLDPNASRSRVLEAYRQAKCKVDAAMPQESGYAAVRPPTKRPTVLTIDAARARAILRRVANRPLGSSIPLANAAQLDQVSGDEEAVRAVAVLWDLGIVSDDELT